MMQLDGLAAALESVALPAPRLVLAATGGRRPDPDAIWISRVSGEDWTGWSGIGQPVGGALPCRPALACDVHGILRMAVSGHDGAVWHVRQEAQGHPEWLDWESLGRPGGQPVITKTTANAAPDASPVIALNADKTLGVFVVRSDLSVWCRREKPGSGGWGNWESLGCPSGPHDGTVGPLTAAVNADGRVEVFTTDSNGVVRHCWQVEPNGSWSRWGALGLPSGQLAGRGLVTVRNNDGRLELFAIGAADGAVWHRRQSQPGGSWADWASLGDQGRGFAEITVAADAGDRLVLFATEQLGQPDPYSATGLWQCAQPTPGGGWSPWRNRSDLLNSGPDTPIEGPVLVLGEQNWLRLLTRASGGADIYEAIQVKADSTAVDAWDNTMLEFHPV